MMRRNIYMGLLVVILHAVLGCDEAQQTRVEDIVFKFPVVVDTFQGLGNSVVESEQKYSHYVPTYIGPPKDSIWVAWMADCKGYEVPEERNPYVRPDSGDLLIRVDTSAVVSRVTPFINFRTGESGIQTSPSYSVFLGNLTRDTLAIGSQRRLPLILQARDSDGTWADIQEFGYDCGTGAMGLLLPPGEIVMTSVPIHHGDSLRLLRLRYGQVMFSNEFVL